MRIHRDYASTAALCVAGLAVVGGLSGCGTTVATNTNSPNATSAGTTSDCVAGPDITQRVVTSHYVMVLDLGPPQQMYTAAQVAAHDLTAAEMVNGEVMISGAMVPYPGMSMSGMMGMGTTKSMGSMKGMGATTTTAKSMGSMKGMGATTTTAKSKSGMMGMGMGATTTTTKSKSGMMGMGTTPTTSAVPLSYYYHLEVHVCSPSTGKVVTGGNPRITVVDNSTNKSTVVPVSVMEGIEIGLPDYHYGNNVIMPPGSKFTVKVVFGSDTASFHVSTPAA